MDPPIFRTEDSLWQMLCDGSKTWDARKWDMTDERIKRLLMKTTRVTERSRLPIVVPVEPLVAFLNKASGQVATFRYRGYDLLEDKGWASGWVFLLLGERVWPI